MNIASYIYKAWTNANDFVNIILSTVHLYLTKKMWKNPGYTTSSTVPLQLQNTIILEKLTLHPNFSFFYLFTLYWSSVQFSSVAQLCLTLCDSMDCRTPRLPVHHQLPEIGQTHVHWVGDYIQPSNPGLSASPPTFSLSQHRGLFQWVSLSHQVAKVLEFQLQHQSLQWTLRTDLL